MNTSAKIVKISLTAIEKRPEVVGREGELMKNVCKVLYVVDIRENTSFFLNVTEIVRNNKTT